MYRNSQGRTLFCEDELAVSRYVIYTPSQFAKSGLIYPQEAGILKAVRPYETGRFGLNSYLFFVVISGSGVFLYEDVRYEIKSGDCVFIDCRKKYSQISSKDLWTLQWVHLNGEPMSVIYKKYQEHGGSPVFSTDYSVQYQDLLNAVYQMSGDSSYVNHMELCEKLMSLLTLLMRETQKKNRTHHISKLNVVRVKEYLDLHYMEQITLDKLAEIFYIDKFYLTKIFKAEYDTTIKNYLNQVRITKAKELLRFSELSIEEVGRSVGISESNYFSRVFKKIEGITPSSYRLEW